MALRVVEEMIDDTKRFREDVLMEDFPDSPRRLSEERKNFALVAFREEVEEFSRADTIEGEADALIDLVYYALGRLVEMGVHVPAAWSDVHDANMSKVRGDRDRDTDEDAVKPGDWRPPDLSWLRHVSPVFAVAARLREKKGRDYQPEAGVVAMSDYFPYGLASYAQMIHTKSLRLVAVADPRATAPPANESVIDTLVDLVNYASYAYEHLAARGERR